MSHKYDILVMGASGFTGQLVAKYLASQAPLQNFTWAAGGRNREKIEQKMREVNVEPSEIFIADSQDEDALRTAVKQVKVVISLIGPYLLHGEKLVKVCAEEGTHYLDLTGETPFIYKTVQRYQRAALDSKALILHTSGFDSIPSDLGAFLAVQRLKQAGGDETLAGAVRTSFKAKGGMSGGTLSSLLAVVEAPKESRDVASRVYALSPIEGKHTGRPVVVSSQAFRGKKTFGSFFLMAPINIPVVNRSWGILESADPSSRVLRYGPNFVYDEFMAMPGPISSFIASTIMLLSFGAIGKFRHSSFLLFPVHISRSCRRTKSAKPSSREKLTRTSRSLRPAAVFSPVRWLLRRFGPQAGDGPTEKQRENGWYEVTTVAKSDDGKLESLVVQKGKGDPGYLATSVLISSCALCLVRDYDRLPPIARHGGFLTPATALGNVLVERLEKTGRFSFHTEDNSLVKKVE